MEKLAEGFDHIQGSRFIKGGHQGNTPLSRLLVIKVVHAPLLRWALGFNYTDTTNGFRAYSRKLLLGPRIAVFRNIFSSYELHYYLAIQVEKLGFRCIEVSVARKYPSRGKIPTKISPIRGNLEVLLKRIKVVQGQYDPR